MSDDPYLTPDQRTKATKLGLGTTQKFSFVPSQVNPAADMCAECVNAAIKAGMAPAMARLVCGQMGHCKPGAVGSALPGKAKPPTQR